MRIFISPFNPQPLVPNLQFDEMKELIFIESECKPEANSVPNNSYGIYEPNVVQVSKSTFDIAFQKFYICVLILKRILFSISCHYVAQIFIFHVKLFL